MGYLVFSMQKIMSLENREFSFSLFRLDAFILFSCLIALARTSSIILIQSGEDTHSCFVSDFSEKASSVSLLNAMLIAGVSWMPFIGLKKFFCVIIMQQC